MSKQTAALSYPNNIFKQTTPDEEQALSDNPRFQTWYKGWLTRSEIYERMLPDGETCALRIDGPGDSAFSLDNRGNVRILTGVRDKESGPGSGILGIKTWGQQQIHNNRSNIQYNAGDDKEGQALNIVAYGDIVEQAVGSTRFIRAQKIVIEASEELMLIGKSQVTIQAGSAGGGTITMNAGSVEKITTNDKDVIVGQRMEFGVSEKTTVSFDPRASSNVVSPGHINHKILGDYKQWVGGLEQHLVAGNILSVPMIKDRSSAFTVKTAIGAMTFDAAGAISEKAGGAISQAAGGVISQAAGGAVDVKAGAAFNVDAGAAVSIKAGAAFSANAGADASIAAGANASLTAAGNVNVIGVGDVNIKGALILLN